MKISSLFFASLFPPVKGGDPKNPGRDRYDDVESQGYADSREYFGSYRNYDDIESTTATTTTTTSSVSTNCYQKCYRTCGEPPGKEWL